MIHLKRLPTTLNKSMLKSCKFPLSRLKVLGVLLKSECTSSATQLIQLLNEEGLREPKINTDDENRKVKKILSKFSIFTENVDGNSSTGRLREGSTYEDSGSLLGLGMNTSIEDIRKIIDESDTTKLNVAMSVVNKLCSLKLSFKMHNFNKIKNVQSLIPRNKLNEIFTTIEKNLTFINDDLLVKVLEACAALEISDSSPLMQKLLKLLSSNINSMSSNNVVYIYCVIKKHYSTPNPQVAALIAACKNIFENCFESNFHPNLGLKISHYVSEEYLPISVREFLIKNLLEGANELHFLSYNRILRGLSMPKVFEGDPKYRKECVDHVLNEMFKILEKENYPHIWMYHILKCYRNGVIIGIISYNENFLDTLALNFLKRKPPLLDSITLCRYFFQAGHFNFAFFDYVVSKIENALTSGEFKTIPAYDFYGLVQVLSFAGSEHTKVMSCFYRERLHAACSSVCRWYPKFEKTRKVVLPLNLAVLGIYEDSLIEDCFTSQHGGELTEGELRDFNSFYLNLLLLLHRSVVTFHPSYQKPLLSEEFLKKLASDNFMTSQNNWQEVVESCFGGPNFVMKNCTTPLYHKLSYVVVLDKNNVPIEEASIQGANRATSQPFNIADIQTSEETKVIVIQPQSEFAEPAFKNVFRWKGIFQLELDVLNVYCDGVIVLLNSDFESLPSYERVPFLLRQIEKKFGVIGKPVSAESEK